MSREIHRPLVGLIYTRKVTPCKVGAQLCREGSERRNSETGRACRKGPRFHTEARQRGHSAATRLMQWRALPPISARAQTHSTRRYRARLLAVTVTSRRCAVRVVGWSRPLWRDRRWSTSHAAEQTNHTSTRVGRTSKWVLSTTTR